MSEMDERIEELLPFYALGALTDEERAQVDAYIARSPEAKARLDELTETTSALAFTATPAEPSPQVKQTLMARVDRDARRLKPEPAPRPGLMATLDRFFARFAPYLTAASLAVAIAVGMWAAALNAQVAKMQAQTQSLQAEVAAQREVLAELASPAQQVVTIAGTENRPNAHGHLVTHEDGTAVLVVSGLETLDPTRVYQLWMIAGDTPISAGLFEVDDRGIGVLTTLIDTTPGAFDAIGISVEPAGGSLLPTGEIVMLGQIS